MSGAIEVGSPTSRRVDNLREAVESQHLFHVHICENHRGEYGTGQIGPKTGDMLNVLRGAEQSDLARPA